MFTENTEPKPHPSATSVCWYEKLFKSFQVVFSIFSEIAENAGIKKRVNLHGFRHWAITSWIRSQSELYLRVQSFSLFDHPFGNINASYFAAGSLTEPVCDMPGTAGDINYIVRAAYIQEVEKPYCRLLLDK